MNQTIAARTDPQPAHAYWTMSRGDSARAFQAARRHSRLVRVLRIAVPLAVVLGFAGIFAVTYLNPLRMLAKLPINVGDLVVNGTKITMEHPRLSGFTRDERAYELSADAAKQDLTKPDEIELRNIRAKVQMQDNSTMELSATAGVYDSKAETLKLDQNILLTSTSGYRGQLSEALIDIRKGYVVSDKPVKVEMLQGALNASRLEIVDSGDLVRFDGGVNMTLMLGDAAAARMKDGAK
ncbi:MAG: LPS export ABC transporter periplasmic protein LptC [Pseudolabrys sp.]